MLKTFFRKLLSRGSIPLSEIADKYKNADRIDKTIINEVFAVLSKPGCVVYIAATGYDSENNSMNIISAKIDKNTKTLYVFSTEEKLRSFLDKKEVPVVAINGEFLMDFADSGGFDQVILDNKIELKDGISSLSKLESLIANFNSENKPATQEFLDSVLDELVNGSSDIFIGTDKDNIKKGEGFNITTSGLHEGAKTIWVFSSTESLLEANKRQTTPYIRMSSQDMLKLVESNDFKKIIVDRLVPISRLPEGVAHQKISKDTPIRIGLPKDPIPKKYLDKIISYLKKHSKIIKVYHFLLQQSDECNLIIGYVVFDDLSSNEVANISSDINKLLQDSKFKFPVSFMNITGNEDIIEHLEGLEKALIYSVN